TQRIEAVDLAGEDVHPQELVCAVVPARALAELGPGIEDDLGREPSHAIPHQASSKTSVALTPRWAKASSHRSSGTRRPTKRSSASGQRRQAHSSSSPPATQSTRLALPLPQ